MARVRFVDSARTALALSALTLLCLLCLAPAARASFDSIPAESLVTDGTVNALAVSGETLYLGGSFQTIGRRTGQAVLFNSDLSMLDSSIPQVSGGERKVDAVISDGAGGWYVGGAFSDVGGVARTDLAHILANDTVDPNFHPQVDGAVHELALSESGATLFVAGEFQTVAGQPRPGMAALETATGTATAFDPKPNNDYGACGIGVDGGYVFVCGDFTEVGGQAREGKFAELNAADGSATSWYPEPEGYDRATALYLSPAKVLYLAYNGRFGQDKSGTYYEGVAALQIAAEPEKPPTFVTSFHPNITEVAAFYQLGETLYVGGRFNQVAFAPADKETENFTTDERENLASFDIAKGYELLPFHPTPNGGEYYGKVGEITGGSGELYIGGYFGSVGGQPRTSLSAVDPTTGAPVGANPEIDGNVNTIAASGSSLYVGGSFALVHGATRHNIAAIDTATGELEEAFDPGLDGRVTALATNGQTLYAGGEFRNATGTGESSQGRNDLAAFNTADGKLTPFKPEPNGVVSALAISGQTLFAGGGFSKLHEVAHGTLAAFNTSTEATEAFNPEPNGGVDALTVSSGRLYAGGAFSKLSGESGAPARNDIAAFELPSEALDPGFAPPSFDGSVSALAASGSSVYAGGDFNDVGETYRPRLAALRASDGTLEEWEPEVSNDVDSLLLDGSTLYAGGIFGDAGGAIRPSVAGLSTETGGATAFDPEPDGDVRALALGPSALYLGGSFTEVGGLDQSYFATFDSGSLAEEEARGGKGEGGAGEGEAGSGTSGTEGSSAGASALASTPSTFITAGPSYYTSARTETFTFASDVEGATFRCSLDGSAPSPCTSPYTTATLALGAHRFEVQAVEPSGTVDLAGASESFVVVAPGITPTPAAGASPAAALRLTHVRWPARIALGVTAAAKHKHRHNHKHKRRKATRISFSSSEAAIVTISLKRIQHVRCRKHRACIRLVAAGTITVHAHAGSNHERFTARIRGKLLRPGHYRATLVARSAAAVSPAVTVSFHLLANRRGNRR